MERRLAAILVADVVGYSRLMGEDEVGKELNVEELRRHCRAHLSPQKTPMVWCRVEAFPLTGSGKIQTFMLRDRYLAGEYRPL